MNRSDWVFVAVRLTGLWLLVLAAVGLPGLITSVSMSRDMQGLVPSDILMSQLVSLLLNALLGAGLFLGTPRIERWLAARDARSGPSERSSS